MNAPAAVPSILDSAETDRGAALAILEDALNGADDGELYLEKTESESQIFDDGRLKSADYDASEGFGLRVVAGETAGYGHAATTAEGPRATNTRLYGDDDPLASPAFSEKIELLKEIDAYAREKDPRVVQVSASLAGERKVVEILRGDGRLVRDVRPLVRLNVSVTVERAGLRARAYTGAGGRAGFETWIAPDRWRDQVDEALRQALVNLDAIDCPGGEMDVVLGPGWPGVLLHEAVGHGLEGEFDRKGSSAFSGKIGQRVAAKGVTVIDDGSIAGRRGSLSVDYEGTPTNRTVLIEDGILVGYMHDRMSARLMGMTPTGNGRRQSFAHMPMPRMTNTFMLGGNDKLADMISSTKRGLYAVNFGGGQVDIVNGKFVFQCTEAYLIEDGKVTVPVKGATLIGDGPTALTKIEAIGEDFELVFGVGVCGLVGLGVLVGFGLLC